MTRGCPNGETHYGKTVVRPDEYIVGYEQTQGSEPSQYLKEKKTKVIPIVVASELGTSPNPYHFGGSGVVGPATVELPIWLIVEVVGKPPETA